MNQENNLTISERIKGKRIASFDFGMKRIGWAVCDEYHITTTTKGIFERSKPDLWTVIKKSIESERIGYIIVGVPLRHDEDEQEERTALMKKIDEFAIRLRKETGLEVLEVDEAYSSRRALATMAEIGIGKTKRRDKSRKDEISAAIILRDFLQEYSM
jgi:putative holliday junction resolvase